MNRQALQIWSSCLPKILGGAPDYNRNRLKFAFDDLHDLVDRAGAGGVSLLPPPLDGASAPPPPPRFEIYFGDVGGLLEHRDILQNSSETANASTCSLLT